MFSLYLTTIVPYQELNKQRGGIGHTHRTKQGERYTKPQRVNWGVYVPQEGV